jgi:SAM-dependent methyltransferase
MDAKPFDVKQIEARWRKAGAAPVTQELARRLEERLADVKGIERVLWLGVEALEPDFVIEGGPYDAVVVPLVMTCVNDVPAFLYKCVQALKPDGLVLATVLGVESFKEFRAAWAAVGDEGGHVIPLTDVREAGGLLQRLKLALPVVDRDIITVTFADFKALYKALRDEGAGNASPYRRQGLLTPRKLAVMEEAYRRLFVREDGRLPLTVEVIYLHGFRPGGENQPTAARRGSGKVSLVRILGEGGA